MVAMSDDVVTGVVTKTTSFGAFVELEDGLEGLLHISELAEHKVENPEEVVRPGQRVTVKVLRVDPSERKIGLSLKRVPVEDQVLYQEAAEAAGTGLPEAGAQAAGPGAEAAESEPNPEGAAPPEAPAPEVAGPEPPEESGLAEEAPPSSPPPTTA
jgi:small subunit ribosomal protein S1